MTLRKRLEEIERRLGKHLRDNLVSCRIRRTLTNARANRGGQGAISTRAPRRSWDCCPRFLPFGKGN
jgi:hypothetical protein